MDERSSPPKQSISVRDIFGLVTHCALACALWSDFMQQLESPTRIVGGRFSHNGKFVAIFVDRAENPVVQIHNATSGALLRSAPAAPWPIHLGSETLAYRSNDELRFESLATGAPIATVPLPAKNLEACHIALNDSIAAIAGDDGSLAIVTLAKPASVRRIDCPFKQVAELALSGDRKLLVVVGESSSSGHRIAVIDVGSGSVLRLYDRPEHAYIHGLCFTRRDVAIAIGYSVPTARIVSLSEGVADVVVPLKTQCVAAMSWGEHALFVEDASLKRFRLGGYIVRSHSFLPARSILAATVVESGDVIALTRRGFIYRNNWQEGGATEQCLTLYVGFWPLRWRTGVALLFSLAIWRWAASSREVQQGRWAARPLPIAATACLYGGMLVITLLTIGAVEADTSGPMGIVRIAASTLLMSVLAIASVVFNREARADRAGTVAVLIAGVCVPAYSFYIVWRVFTSM